MRRFGLIIGIMFIIAAIIMMFVFPAGTATDILIRSLTSAPRQTNEEVPFPAGSNGYVIVAPDSILKLGAIRKFISHKIDIGFRMEAVSIEEIEDKIPEGDRADKIRQYLKNKAQKLDLRYLLLIGDPDPQDRKVQLPISAELPPYIVSVPSRSLGGTYVADNPDNEISVDKNGSLVVLTGPNLQVLRPGTLRYWYVNCTAPGKIALRLFRKKETGFEKIYAGPFENVHSSGVAVRGTEPIELKTGDYVGFELPSEGAAKVAAVKTPETITSHILEPDRYSELSSAGTGLEKIPLILCSVYFEPVDRAGSVPSKMCWPMGTYNGVYSAMLRDSCLSQCPTDAYFADLSGNWDANGNGFYGETFIKFFRYDGGAKAGELFTGDFRGAGDSFLPEILVGRIPFDEPEVISAILEKTIAYEISKDREWRRHCLLGADPLAPDTDSYALCELIRNKICVPAGFKATRFYTEHVFDEMPIVQSPRGYKYEPEFTVPFDTLTVVGRDTLAGYELFSKIWKERHPGIVVWSSHANMDICRNIVTLRDVTDEKYPQAATYRYVNALDDSHPAIVFAVACSVTQPEPYYLGVRKKRTRLEHDWETRPNIGRELMRNGAVAFIGPTRSTWFQHGWNSIDDGGCLSLAYDFTDRLVNGESVGYSLGAAVRDYHTRWGSELGNGQNIIGFVLYGDPSLSLGLARKNKRPLLKRQVLPELTVSYEPTDMKKGLKINFSSKDWLELETGAVCEVDKITAGADGREQWFTADGFSISEKRFTGGESSYYSGTARHRRSTLTLSMPLMPGQELTALFNCWYKTEPGLDYVVFEKSPDMVSWEPIDVYSGSSTHSPLFQFENPFWQTKEIKFQTGNKPLYLRFRYVTNDQYRRDAHEGFYVDNFAIMPAEGKKVKYISGWQQLKQDSRMNAFIFKPRGPGSFYLRTSTKTMELDRICERSDILNVEVSEPRSLSFKEHLSRNMLQLQLLLAVAGLVLIVLCIIPGRKKVL